MAESTLSSRGFRGLWLAHFFGAFTDNFLKIIVSLLAVKEIVSGGGEFMQVVWGGICFVVPFLLFSPIAGSLADRYPKAYVCRGAKLVELIVALAAVVFFGVSSLAGLFVCLFLLGVHTAIFSPSKYGLLPELLGDAELSRGNGLIELGTFLGAILGSALAGLFAGGGSGAAIVMLFSSGAGLVAATFIPVIAPKNPESPLRFNPLELIPVVKELRSSKPLWLTVIGMTYFWSLASLYQLNISLSAKELSHWSDLRTSALLALLGLGIGLGGALAGKVSEGRVELGLVPLGSASIGITSILLGGLTNSYVWSLFTVFAMGVSGGFFVIPLNSFFQQQSPAASRGSYIAAANWMTYCGVLISYALLALVVGLLRFSPAAVFFLCGLSALAATVIACRQMPQMLLRCLNWLVTHTLYRLHIVGLENVPESGGALIICNHVAYVDPPLLLAAAKRPVRFLMFRPIYEFPLIKPIAKLAGAIPISPENPKKMLQSLAEARAAVEAGELVCIFAEGELTRIGHLLSFKKGFERIMKGLSAPIVPAYLDQIWGSIFSHRDGKFFWKIPKQIPYPVTLAFGKPLPAHTPAFEVRQAISEMAADIACTRPEKYKSLHSAFLSTVKRKWFSRCVGDSGGLRLSYAGLLIASLALRERFLRDLKPNRSVAVLLPPTVAGVAVNVALSFARKVSVNLNFTASAESIEYAIKSCEVEHIITSRAFLQKIKFDERPGMVFVEDLFRDMSGRIKAKWAVLGLLLPRKILLRWILRDGTERSDLATIIFSSGSTAEPKGVMLTQGNISANIESIYQVFQLERKDGVMGSLPFFHSFGYTATLWLPLLCGIRAFYHPNPMEAGTIGELVAKERSTVLFSTPTFLLGYIRKCTPEQFKSLRYVVVGAEKLKDRVASAFVEKFGIMPMEGYGTTELSPVALINVPSYDGQVVKQVGQKLGTAGHALPGVAVRIVDPDTFVVLPPETEGLLLVRGPNVMAGYLGNEAKTSEVMRDGWYITGDIAKIDEDGFVTITDRLSRFSKIAGEMVPHAKVEEAILRALGDTDAAVAVTSVDDDKRGEKLVVLSTKALDTDELMKRLGDFGLPNLWIPKRENFHVVEALPLLGTGKLDLKSIKKMAVEHSASAGE